MNQIQHSLGTVQGPNTKPTPFFEQLEGYQDEELMSYLADKPVQPPPKPQPKPEEPIMPPTSAVPPPTEPDSRIWDLMLYIFTGILIIFMMEQVFKIGVMIGMRRTTDFMEPFFEYASHLGTSP